MFEVSLPALALSSLLGFLMGFECVYELTDERCPALRDPAAVTCLDILLFSFLPSPSADDPCLSVLSGQGAALIL